jgi:quercetin dioxygenase-like cupin family protein
MASREPLGRCAPSAHFRRPAAQRALPLYANANDRLGIDFAVERIEFPGAQVMDPRIVRIAPGKHSERHRHAHESLFVVLEGQGHLLLGDDWLDLRKGDLAFVPRWIFHQTRNTSTDADLVVLAVTDFGLTSATLGDYDRRTRLREAGEDAAPPPSPAPEPRNAPAGAR